MQHHHLTATEWDALANDPQFVSLLRARRRFVVPCTIFFLAFYLGLPIGIGFAPDAMNAQVGGGLTVAYAYGLSQFVMAWVLLALYMQAAKRFDERANAIVARVTVEKDA
jgi:uncharacterized membrane protein (DUF485 family)